MNQSDHWDYTIREWKTDPFRILLEKALELPTPIIYDIGACVGGWSQVMHELLPEAQIYAFEPYPENYEALVEHAIPHVMPINFGVWYGKRTAKAMWRGSNVGAIFIDEVDTTMATDTGKTFNLVTLEELDLPRPQLVKLDVEGAEKNILKHSSLLRRTPQIIVEYHFVGVEDARELFKDTLPHHHVVGQIQEGMFLLRHRDYHPTP